MSADDIDDYKPFNAYDGGSTVFEPTMHVVKPGDELNLTKKDPTLKYVLAGMGWDFRGFDADPPDLDVCVLLLDKDGQARMDEDFVFYNNPMSGDGAVRHLGDSRTGAGDGDDEQIEVNLATLPFELMRVVFVLSLYNLDVGLENHNFSMVKNVYFRLINQETQSEIFRFELNEDILPHDGSAVLIGELERMGNEWIFHGKGEGIKGGLAKFASERGMLITQNVQS